MICDALIERGEAKVEEFLIAFKQNGFILT